MNPAWEIASRLPEYLPADVPSSTDPSPQQASAPILPPVRILVHPEAIRVNYKTVRALVPKLWETRYDDDGAAEPSAQGAGSDEGEKPRKIDLCIHIGMADPRLYYSIEHRGHRDGYTMPDVDGEKLRDDEARRREGDDWVWADVPSQLETDLDVRDVLGRWRKHSPVSIWASHRVSCSLLICLVQAFSDLRVSEDAGHYLCDFIYFSSLAHLYKNGEYRRVIFLHVPSDASDKAVAKGKDLTIHLIRSLVESELSRQRKAQVVSGDKVAVELRV